MTFSRISMVGVLALSLIACGGGGGSAGSIGGEAGTAVSSGGSTVNIISPVQPADSAKLSLAVVNSSGVTVSSIAVGGGFSVRATVIDAVGAPVTAKLVTFSLNGSSIATANPLTALTDASGVAAVAISPASISSVGAASLSASVSIGTETLTGSVDFSVAATSLTLSPITVGVTNLQSAGITSIRVTALVAGAPSAVPVNVTYSTSCGRINDSAVAGGFSVTTDGTAVASAVYTAIALDGSLCSGSVTITASSAGATSQQTTVTVAAATANAITFVSAQPSQIFVAGSGAAEQSIVKFRVLASGGSSMPNVSVQFSIVTNPGGVGLSAAGLTTPVSVTTNASGEASVAVFSGSIPGPVKLKAELGSDANIFAESQNLTVASGPPSQRYMSLSVETFNIEGWARDGTSTQFTVRLADRQGNAVADGTVVNFTAEGGQIASSCATAKVNGISQCSVTFVSQNPRPAGGRVSVLAIVGGTKDYVDADGNNRYDTGIDTLSLIGDPYRDDNENGKFDSGEFLIPLGGTGTCAGAGAVFPSRVNTCDTNLGTRVRQQAVVMFSSSEPADLLFDTEGNFVLSSKDNPLLPMPAGTTIAATAFDQTSGNSVTCSIIRQPSSPLPNVSPGSDPTINLSTKFRVGLKDCAVGDSYIIDVTSPAGLKTSFTINL